ncbi:MAG: hypothetical protein AAFY31_04760 [Pseudomonadota bacterium]
MKYRYLRYLVVSVVAVMIAGVVHAQDRVEILKRASPVVSQLVNEICVDVELRSVRTKGAFTLDGAAKIRGLAGRLVDGGVELSTEAEREVTEGVLQTDLAALLQKQQACRTETFEYLMDFVLGEAEVSDAAAPPPRSNIDEWLRLARGTVAERNERNWGVAVMYRVPLYKVTSMPLVDCSIELELVGPDTLRAMREDWWQNYKFTFLDDSWSYAKALEYAGETRTIYEVTLQFPKGKLPVEDIVFDAYFECENYTSPNLEMVLAAP